MTHSAHNIQAHGILADVDAGVPESILTYMQSEDFDYLYRLEESFWWFLGMRDITRVLLDQVEFHADDGAPRKSRVLDAGCGTGGMLEWLAGFAPDAEVSGIDIAPDALHYARSRGHLRLAQASATELPFADEAFDIVTSFDVLVQLPGGDAAERAMNEMHRVLRPGGVCFVRVAAYSWMRSGHDRALGTVRRFNLNELQTTMQASGFEILRTTYANACLLPVAALHRLVLKPLNIVNAGSDVKPLAPRLQWLNRLMTGVLRSEARRLAHPHARLPFGLSAICIGRRPL